MEYIIDVHTHTISSGHAYSTIDENAKFASSIGMKLIAMTDHAPSMPGSATQIHFNNLKVLPEKLYDVEILKGAELNIMDFEGTVDLNEYSLKKLDIAIASLHPPCINAGTIEENTNAYVKVCENKYVSILVPLEKETDYNEEIGKINKMGINIIYEYLESGNVNENKFTYDMEVIVLPEFLDNNLENEYTWDKNGIKFISRNKED